MKYRKVRLVNYIGIVNGIGVNDLTIDFDRCINKVTMIIGGNGKGKSTLWSALDLIPDSNDCFIEKQPASKELWIDEYYFRFIHGVKKSGERDTTKAYIRKDINGEFMELNANGNVGSFMDVLYTELNLDPNYLVLSRLSLYARGLADLRPADRKKYISGIIRDLADYNTMYKTFTKRSSVYKSLLNISTNKINSIGDEDYLSSMLEGIEKRLNDSLNLKDTYIEESAKLKNLIQLLDPDGSSMDKYNQLCKIIIDLRQNQQAYSDEINLFIQNNNVDSDLQSYANDIKSKVNDLSNRVNILEADKTNQLYNMNSKSQEIQSMEAKLVSIDIGMDITEIKSNIDQTNARISELSSLITSEVYNMDDLQRVQSVLQSVNAQMIQIGSSYSYDILSNLSVDNTDYETLISNLQSQLSNVESDIAKYNGLLKVSEALSNRPSECKIDTCAFIVNALEAFKQNPSDMISKLELQRNDLSNKIASYINLKNKSVIVKKCNNDIDNIVRYISSYNNLFSMLKINISREDIISYTMTAYGFQNEYKLINDSINISNIANEIVSLKNSLASLQMKYDSIKDKQDVIDMLKDNINTLRESVNTISKKIIDINSNIAQCKVECDSYMNILKQLNRILDISIKKKFIDSEITDTSSRMYTMQSNIQSIQSNMSQLEQVNLKINELNKNIAPTIEDRDTIKHNLKLLKEYKAEYNDYAAKYSKIEVFKKYASPTKGIGVIFIQLYMNTTLTIINDLLNMVFEGRYYIPEFNIDDNIFKIPCYGNSLANDDISSMSGGEVAIISMIISFAIMYQSSTKYNVFRLDEVDAPLDSENRRLFVNVLYKIIDILGLEQVIIISHNREIPMANTDMIIFGGDDEITEGNVIYRAN